MSPKAAFETESIASRSVCLLVKWFPADFQEPADQHTTPLSFGALTPYVPFGISRWS